MAVEKKFFEGNKKTYIHLTGTSGFTHIIRPDDFQGKVEYKIEVSMTEEDLSELQDIYNELWGPMVESFRAESPKNAKMKLKETPTLTGLREADDGTVYIKAKTRFRPSVTVGDKLYKDPRDSSNPDLDALRFIRNGETVTVMCEPIFYPGLGSGISLRAVNVKVDNLEATGAVAK